MKNIILIVVLLGSIGCSNTSTDPTLQNSTMTFYGSYFAADDSANIALQKTDSVELVIVNERSYSLSFIDEAGGVSDFCDHTGQISGFYTRFVRFTPTDFFETNCDNNRIPNNEFLGDYTSYGDTIYITYQKGDTLKRLKLVE